MLTLGTHAPDFALPEVTDGTTVSLDDVAGSAGSVVVFLCRHCPYVQHVQATLVDLAEAYQQQGIGFVGISANDPAAYPDDAPERLAAQKREVGFPFPYLFDETQEVAKAYGAVCTPDPFVFDGHRRLAYRGRIDETRPGRGSPTGSDLRRALDAVLAGEPVPTDQHPAMGCSIKWRPGNEPPPPGLPTA